MKHLLRLSAVLLSVFLLSACGGDPGSGTDTTNTPPTACATANPTTVTEGDAVTLDGSGSSDSDGSIASYEWKEGSTTLSTQQSFTTSSLAVGTHTITLTVTDNDGASGSANVVVTVESTATVTNQLKKTGQTKSYDENGNEATDGSVKDDGYYQTGVTPSYTRDDAKEIVTDNITGLMWQDNNDTETVTKPWLTRENYDKCTGSNNQTQDTSKCTDTSGDTAATYCDNLTLGGYSDWRLPTIEELENIVDFGHYDPATVPGPFQHVTSGNYWSSTTHANDAGNAWHVRFWGGNSLNRDKSGTLYVRCVRGGE